MYLTYVSVTMFALCDATRGIEFILCLECVWNVQASSNRWVRLGKDSPYEPYIGCIHNIYAYLAFGL